MSFSGLHFSFGPVILNDSFYSPTSSFKAEDMMSPLGRHSLTPGIMVQEMVMCHFVQDCRISRNTGWIAMTFCTDIHSPQRVKPAD